MLAIVQHGPACVGPAVALGGGRLQVGHLSAQLELDHPQELVGVDMWWRSIDNGEDANATPDLTTGLGFAFPGSTITAESWCQDQPAVLVLRELDPGSDLKIKIK